jgi:hypothetical protein
MIEKTADPTIGEPRDLVVRDDEADFAALLDAAIDCRRRGARLRFIDAGRFTVLELEWLAEKGAEIYTSDLARTNVSEIILMSAASRKGGAATSYFHHGPLDLGAPDVPVGEGAVREMARSGVFVAVSNKARRRQPESLLGLADDGLRGRCPVVYYHHGGVEAWLEDLGRQGAWIHVATASVGVEEDAVRLAEAADAASAAGQGLVVHLERHVPLPWLEDLFAAGAYLLFEIHPTDFRSPLRALERKAARRIPGPRAGYLYLQFMR